MTLSSSILAYENLSFEIKPRRRGPPRRLIDDISVQVKAGELLAIMGPSGAGKTTLLELMAFRKPAMAGASATLNGRPIDAATMHGISAFVETDDALLGVLTVRESIAYTLRLYAPSLSRKVIAERVNRVVSALGLQSCADNRIGTPLLRGVSNGQKRRVVAACAMVTYPRILFLDEVTSGLDSTCAEQVLAAIRSLAVEEGMIVLASIHQPSMATLSYFTNLLMLSGGKNCFYGSVSELGQFFTRWGNPVPPTSTPPEYAMYFLNDDFEVANTGLGRADDMREYYLSTLKSDDSLKSPMSSTGSTDASDPQKELIGRGNEFGGTFLQKTLILSERTATNYSRNIFAYGIRAGIYGGMGILIGTICLRLPLSDKAILTRLALHFVTVAFLSFASAAGVPAFLEERAVYYRESRNGLYSALPFLVSNTVVNIPFLFACSVLYCGICYYIVRLNPEAAAFFRFLAYSFLAALIGESQMFFLATLFPLLMITLSMGALLNAFWMGISGFLIKPSNLPRFWYYSLHHMNYMKYAIELLMNSDLQGVTFFCPKKGNKCNCAYGLFNPVNCSITGEQILDFLEYGDVPVRKWVGILLSMFAFYRLAMYLALRLRKN